MILLYKSLRKKIVGISYTNNLIIEFLLMDKTIARFFARVLPKKVTGILFQ
jgi:predicted nucleic acid-binding protein